jgi:hypothetical protein
MSESATPDAIEAVARAKENIEAEKAGLEVNFEKDSRI